MLEPTKSPNGRGKSAEPNGFKGLTCEFSRVISWATRSETILQPQNLRHHQVIE